MSANGVTLNTQVPTMEINVPKPPKKRAKADKAPKEAPSDSSSEHLEDDDCDNLFQAVTKFKNLKAGCYYKIVSLGKTRQRNRLVAVPVKGFEGAFRNFNNVVQQ